MKHFKTRVNAKGHFTLFTKKWKYFVAITHFASVPYLHLRLTFRGSHVVLVMLVVDTIKAGFIGNTITI